MGGGTEEEEAAAAEQRSRPLRPPDPCPPQYHLGFHPHILPLLYRTTFRFLFFLFFFPLFLAPEEDGEFADAAFFFKKERKVNVDGPDPD